MKSLKIFFDKFFDKKNVLTVFAVSTALDALITYIALKSFPLHLEEGNCFLSRLMDSLGLEWALVVWLAINIAVLPALGFFWNRFFVRWLVYAATLGRVVAVIYNINIAGDLFAYAARLL